ncbi:hypothetical protein K8Z49_32310 [Actinomadura madurae]|uniref:hypothetical protein n=1 Tax=Actinomadura madurae TaxID=1993 RepID=UPI00399AAF0B
MPYDPGDARAALRSTGPGKAAEQAAAADYLRFYELPPDEQYGAAAWYGRSQHLVIGYLDVSEETVVEHEGGPDEFGLLLPDPATGAVITIDGTETEVAGETLSFIPPGPATVRLRGPGQVVTITTTRSPKAAARASNARAYDEPHPNVAPLEPWPEPAGGYRLRTYSLDVPGLENPPFRIFRCSSFMVNYTRPRTGPRDTAKMSPHSHDDFEQLSLIIDGEYVHHLRWPWTTDLDEWRPDEHEHCGSPSLTVIPPPTVHTSQAIGAGSNHLIDIFAPPRLDFSQQDGWVLNAADYPMPSQAAELTDAP